MLEFKPELIGKPIYWETSHYGKIAVHLTGFSPNGMVANISIDGGPDSTPANRFPELADGKYFATPEQLSLKPSRAKIQPVKGIRNTVRAVPGIGKVAVVEQQPKLMKRLKELNSTEPKSRRLPILKALDAADEMRGTDVMMADDSVSSINWPQPGTTPARNKRRLGLNAALNAARTMADGSYGKYNWAQPGEVTF